MIRPIALFLSLVYLRSVKQLFWAGQQILQGPWSKTETETCNLSGNISVSTIYMSTIGFSHFLDTKVHDTANLIQAHREGYSAQQLQVFKSCFCLFCSMWQIFISHFLAPGIHRNAALPKTNTTNSVTLNMYDKTLTFCQKNVTPMLKVALSIHVGCCASLHLSF